MATSQGHRSAARALRHAMHTATAAHSCTRACAPEAPAGQAPQARLQAGCPGTRTRTWLPPGKLPPGTSAVTAAAVLLNPPMRSVAAVNLHESNPFAYTVCKQRCHFQTLFANSFAISKQCLQTAYMFAARCVVPEAPKHFSPSKLLQQHKAQH